MGELFLVGMGPGDLGGLTQKAREALERAQVVIGYSTYVKLLEEMGLLSGKELVRKGMTEELDRAEEALERALSGQRVALVSGGDPGVYGMAAPVLELMEERGFLRVDGGVGLPGRFALGEKEVALEVIPWGHGSERRGEPPGKPPCPRHLPHQPLRPPHPLAPNRAEAPRRRARGLRGGPLQPPEQKAALAA
jgi:hypothetical protein